MMYSQIQSFLMPFSFGLLFMLMLVYWTQATLFSHLKYKKITTFFLGFAVLSLTTLLVVRWMESGHFPLSNLYESLVFLSWSFLLSHVLLQSFSANELVGVVTSPMALFTYGFASFSLPKEMQQATSLVPALQSNWLMMHVSIMVLSYAALLCGSLLSMAFLVLTSDQLGKLKEETSSLSLTPLPLATVFAPVKGTSLSKQSQVLPYPRQIDLFDRDTKSSSDGNTISPMQFTKCTSFPMQSGEPCSPFTEGDGAHPPSVSTEGDPVQTALDKGCIHSVKEQRFEKYEVSPPPTTSGGQVEAITKGGAEGFEKSETLVEGNIALTLDNLSYRLLGLGFPLLTVGIISGAVWANEAWGSYWSWDPKETWAFITWLVFAIYLHARITKGWVGKKPALIATIGFFVVWFCYLGVNLLGTGLHSYGWFSNKV
uniref:Cytochrome c biogenesis protein CcsA n=1 Tax=Watanabea reniformis TaxID=191674 RepID=A0A097KK48_9CHLO|nr:heme attachment to plastid cytochrome c [Watanabea reniformis]AIT93554.1 heme attachment to plastid cytochrome c [Watanabea reniformis]